MLRFAALPAALLLLAGCNAMSLPGWPQPSPRLAATASAWTKPGADAAAVESAYDDCRAATDIASRKDYDIDQDIAASRSSDLQHSEFAQTQMQQSRDTTRDRAQSMLSACMTANGFSPSGK
jgi:hypothetical protein